MEKILNNLRTAIEQAENDMRTIASNNIIAKQENSEYHNQTMYNIQIIGKMKGMLSSYTPSGLPFSTKLKGKRLKALYIDGVRYSAKYMKDVARVVCQVLSNTCPQELINVCESILTPEKGEIVMTLNKNKLNCDCVDNISVNDKKIYFDANKLTINNMALLRKLLNKLSFSESRIVLDVDDQYNRKVRNSKTKQLA